MRTRWLVWTFGHAGVRGSAFGYLSNPDDAYLLRNGLFVVADIQNCRVLLINRAHRVVREIGHAGSCGHNPPRSLSSPNGATPLADGSVLVTEIGGWVDRISASGRLLWTIRTLTSYPSDAQLLLNGNVLVAGFENDERSLEADNTAAFNCRYVIGPGPLRWSAHAYGSAIDVNPVENPYLESGRVHPRAGRAFLDRGRVRPGMAVRGGLLVRTFAAVGWQWGGRWTGSPDYQHFSATGG